MTCIKCKQELSSTCVRLCKWGCGQVVCSDHFSSVSLFQTQYLHICVLLSCLVLLVGLLGSSGMMYQVTNSSILCRVTAVQAHWFQWDQSEGTLLRFVLHAHECIHCLLTLPVFQICGTDLLFSHDRKGYCSYSLFKGVRGGGVLWVGWGHSKNMCWTPECIFPFSFLLWIDRCTFYQTSSTLLQLSSKQPGSSTSTLLIGTAISCFWSWSYGLESHPVTYLRRSDRVLGNEF